jgi:Bacterial Ig-like domain
MQIKKLNLYILQITITLFVFLLMSSCAQIGAPTGGDRDSLPPVLVSAKPVLKSTNFTDNKITLTFDEYVDVQELQNNLLVSPLPKTNPTINSKLKTVTIKLKDTLLPNTTYSINFGKSIKDVNEGNVINNFTYLFSTGSTIDSLTLSGKIIIAETGKVDSTIIAMLYTNLDDTAVEKFKPKYIAKLNGEGQFTFTNLPKGAFNIFALKDADGGKTYNTKTELFAFADKPISISTNNDSLVLYAFAKEKENKNIKPAGTLKKDLPKKIKYETDVTTSTQSLLNDLVLKFNKQLKSIDNTKIILFDTNYKKIETVKILLDSEKVIINTKWQPDQNYVLVLDKDAVKDSTGGTLLKTDTIRFKTKSETDYGSVVLRFNNLNLSN